MKSLILSIAALMAVNVCAQALIDSSNQLDTNAASIDSIKNDSISSDTITIIEIIDTGISKAKYHRNIAWYIDKGDYDAAYRECDKAALKKKDGSFLFIKADLKLQEYVEFNCDSAYNFNHFNEILNNDTAIIEPPLVLPKELVLEIIEIWKTALDSNEIDFNTSFNIANLYANANMVHELCNLLPKLKFQGKHLKDLRLMMGSLAKAFRERGHFTESIQVYHAIADLYPTDGQILADIAGEYYYQSQIDSALHYIGLALKKRNLTEKSLDNAFILYSTNELYDSASNVLEIIAEHTSVNHNLFYQGVIAFCQEGQNWRGPISIFLRDWDKTNDPSVQLASFMMSEEFQSQSIDDYKKVTDYEIHDGISVLLNKKFLKEIPKSFHFLNNLMKIYVEHHFYQKAVELFNQYPLEGFEISQSQKNKYYSYYAYALDKTSQTQKAQLIWQKIHDSDTSELKAAAAYFIGKHYLSLKDHAQALSYFQSISSKDNSDKFATYCLFWADRINAIYY